MPKSIALIGMAVLAAFSLSAPATADDPNDPSMRTAAARAKDKERIRQLNLQELERVRARDAGYARDWQAYRDYYGDKRPAPQPCHRDRRGRCRS